MSTQKIGKKMSIWAPKFGTNLVKKIRKKMKSISAQKMGKNIVYLIARKQNNFGT